jgi:hypothetical protein
MRYTPDGRERHPLRAALEALGGNLDDWTVMSKNTDPYRLDTERHHVNGLWVARAMTDLSIPKRGRKIHDRGIHYALTQVPGGYRKPNGTIYRNTDKDSEWLEDIIGPALWLGHVDWDLIRDKHNDEPVIRVHESPDPYRGLTVDDELIVPTEDDMTPVAALRDFRGVQPYRVAILGEKSSLYDILEPVSTQYGTDLFLAKGDLTQPMVWALAKAAAADPRPLRVLYFADCDPAGYHMCIVLSRKLSALQLVHFPDLEWQIYRVALTAEQVREYRLPESPLKPGEKRAAKWKERKGVEQTEIDSIATLRPELLEEIAENAVAALHDATLDRRVGQVRRDWERRAAAAVEEQTTDELRRRRREVAERLAVKRAEIEDLIASVSTEFNLPDLPEIPEAGSPEGEPGELVCDSAWSFREQTERLLAQKRYEEDNR